MAVLNDKKGCGWIPMFNHDPTLAHQPTFSNVPHLGLIYFGQEQVDIPYPVVGEYIFMGSPSLTQNDLHIPQSTQQNSETNYNPGDNDCRTYDYTPSTTKEYRPSVDEVKKMRDDNIIILNHS